MTMNHDLLESLTAARKGHFKLESGHHGELWLELDGLFVRAIQTRRFAAELANRFSGAGATAVCGPLVGGAFLAQMVAEELDAEFCYSERVAKRDGATLYSAAYRVPSGLRAQLAGKRVAIVDDVINAGSAVRATWADLEACGATPVALGALVVLGDVAVQFAESKGVPLASLDTWSNRIWAPAECPLCTNGVPLESVTG